MGMGKMDGSRTAVRWHGRFHAESAFSILGDGLCVNHNLPSRQASPFEDECPTWTYTHIRWRF